VSTRVAIYAHYDAHDQVKRYVVHHLRRLRQECDRVYFVSTSALTTHELDKVRPFCADVSLRENVGYDFCMWRDVIARLDLAAVDELVLTNSSVFGPLGSLRPAFERMAEVPCDVWAMTDSEQHAWHLQSYFLVFRHAILQSDDFAQFWRAVLPYKTKEQVIRSYELGLTSWFSDRGWTLRAMVPWREIHEIPPRWPWSPRRWHGPLNATAYLPFTLIERQMPYVKVEVLRDNVGKVSLRALRRAIRATGYDPSLLEYDPR
jgi:lipopolysaccharide biosynthesis protein